MIKIINGENEILFEIVKVFEDDTVQAIIDYNILLQMNIYAIT